MVVAVSVGVVVVNLDVEEGRTHKVEFVEGEEEFEMDSNSVVEQFGVLVADVAERREIAGRAHSESVEEGYLE